MELIQNRVSYYKELSPQCKEHEESIDIIVPDVNPDVLEIVYTSAICTIREKQAGASSVTVAGDIYVKVFYTSEEEGRIFSLGGQIPYSYTCEVNGALPGDASIASAVVLNSSASALNPRKLTLKAEICVDARVFQLTGTNFVTGVDSEADEGIHTRTSSEDYTYLAGVAEKRIAFNEEIRIMSGMITETDRVIRSELTWTAEDVKVMSGKAMLRGSACVKAVTLPENGGNPAENTYKLPFSCIVECDAANEGDDVTVDFQTLQFETQLVTRGEGEIYLYCNIFGNATVMIEKTVDVTLVEDMFSTAYAMTYETEEVPGGVSEPVALEADASSVIETEIPAREVVDYIWYARAGCARSGETEAMDMINGSFYFKVLYTNQNGKLMSAMRRIDVEVPSAGMCPGAYVTARADNVSVTVDAVGAIEIEFDAVFTVTSQYSEPRRQIKSCELSRDKPLERVRDASLVLRALEQGESVWGIAKQYRTSPDAILSANRLESESELKPGKLVIIPFVE